MQHKRFYASYHPACREFWRQYRSHPRSPPKYNSGKDDSHQARGRRWGGLDWDGKANRVRGMFFKGWIEPQSVVRLAKYGNPDADVICYDTRPSSYHAGWCRTHYVPKSQKRGDYYRSWGFCDQSLLINYDRPTDRQNMTAPRPTNIVSVNLVMSCNRAFVSLIQALGRQCRCWNSGGKKTLSQLKCRPPALTTTIVATDTVPLTIPILVGREGDDG